MYWGKGGGYHNANCYGYVFDYWAWTLPGQYAFPDKNWDPETCDITYTISDMIQYVEGDGACDYRERKVEHIYSPNDLPKGALLVACKLTATGDDFHVAVRLPNGIWIDKPGASESRYGKLEGFDEIWEIGGKTYTSDTIYFSYFREGS